jgi:hypothetical protein
MLDHFIKVHISLNPFNSDEFDMLDESLKNFISPSSFTRGCNNTTQQRVLNEIRPELIIYPPSQKPHVQNKPMLIIGPPQHQPKPQGHILNFSKQISNNNVSQQPS